MSKLEKIAVLAGDGIGPEIVQATTAVVQSAADRAGLSLELVPGDVGWKPYKASGTTLPDATRDVLRECAGWIVGPTAAGDYPADDPVKGHPSGFLRRDFVLFANIRPVHAWPQLPALVPELDTTVIRENTEGFYPDRNLYRGYGEFMPSEDVAVSLRVITRKACDRLARLAYEYAVANDDDSLVVVHKRTALQRTDGLFIESFERFGGDFPAVKVEYMRIDTFSSLLAKEPRRFRLVATTNLFGDIISDQASGLVGGVGLAPSLNAGADHAMAQAVHGTAEDLAGKGVANPAALVLSAALLLEWLARRGNDARFAEAGALVRQAVTGALDSGITTPDLGGAATTTQFTEAMVSTLDGGSR